MNPPTDRMSGRVVLPGSREAASGDWRLSEELADSSIVFFNGQGLYHRHGARDATGNEVDRVVTVGLIRSKLLAAATDRITKAEVCLYCRWHVKVYLDEPSASAALDGRAELPRLSKPIGQRQTQV